MNTIAIHSQTCTYFLPSDYANGMLLAFHFFNGTFNTFCGFVCLYVSLILTDMGMWLWNISLFLVVLCPKLTILVFLKLQIDTRPRTTGHASNYIFCRFSTSILSTSIISTFQNLWYQCEGTEDDALLMFTHGNFRVCVEIRTLNHGRTSISYAASVAGWKCACFLLNWNQFKIDDLGFGLTWITPLFWGNIRLQNKRRRQEGVIKIQETIGDPESRSTFSEF